MTLLFLWNTGAGPLQQWPRFFYGQKKTISCHIAPDQKTSLPMDMSALPLAAS